MIVDLGPESAVIVDADDCLHLKLRALPGVDIEAALHATGLGSCADQGRVLLDVEQLRARARAAATHSDWDTAWQAMISYAATKGWLTAGGRSLVAHIETTQELP